MCNTLQSANVKGMGTGFPCCKLKGKSLLSCSVEAHGSLGDCGAADGRGGVASHMDPIWLWPTGSAGVCLPTHSRMVLAGHKSVCSVLPVWAGFSQNEYLWCFHISDKPLESHYVVGIQMRLMAAVQCPTTKTNCCKPDPAYRGLKLNQLRALNDPVVNARPACWWAPYGNMGWGPQLQVGDLKVSCHLSVPWT